MKTKLSKSNFFATLAGLAFSAAIATTGVSAAEDEIILHDAIDDYTGSFGGTYSDTTRYSRGNYGVDIVLDEAYHDYRRSEVVAASERRGEMEQADFAAFEEEAPVDIPWDVSGID